MYMYKQIKCIFTDIWNLSRYIKTQSFVLLNGMLLIPEGNQKINNHTTNLYLLLLQSQNLNVITVHFLIVANIPLFSADNGEVNLSETITFTNNFRANIALRNGQLRLSRELTNYLREIQHICIPNISIRYLKT